MGLLGTLDFLWFRGPSESLQGWMGAGKPHSPAGDTPSLSQVFQEAGVPVGKELHSQALGSHISHAEFHCGSPWGASVSGIGKTALMLWGCWEGPCP